MHDAVEALSKVARSLLDVDEEIACAETAIEQASFHTGGKSFLFAQRKGDLAVGRLELDASMAAARKAGEGVEVGKGGWTRSQLPLARAPSATLKRWARESHARSGTPKAAKKATRRMDPARQRAQRRVPSAARTSTASATATLS